MIEMTISSLALIPWPEEEILLACGKPIPGNYGLELALPKND
jgi:hypothetical protein